MALRDWLPFGRKESATTHAIVLGLGDYVVPDFRYERAAKEAYERNVTAYAAIHLRARCARRRRPHSRS